ncbi:hypothetical protein V1478_016562, partial [Vespula squamosa]
MAIVKTTESALNKSAYRAETRSPRCPVGPQMQQPPSGGTWVGITCDICDLSLDYVTQVLPGEWLHTLMYFQNQFFLTN